jgi:hypothetical protein
MAWNIQRETGLLLQAWSKESSFGIEKRKASGEGIDGWMRKEVGLMATIKQYHFDCQEHLVSLQIR